MTELSKLEEYFESAEETSRNARLKSEQAQDYTDNIQITDEVRKAIEKRGQPVIVINRIQPKVDFLCGMELRTRTDPKAYPRTQKHDKAADAVTDGIRYALDNNEFDQLASEVFENMVVPGTGGASVEVEERGDNIEISIKRFMHDRFFIDPHSRDRFGRDALFMGVVAWKDVSEAKIAFKDKAKEIEAAASKAFSQMADGFSDQPKHFWFDKSRKRIMCVDIAFREAGVWQQAIFAKGVWLKEQEPSAYLNEHGEPANKFFPVSTKVKRNGDRYGFVEAWIDRQDVVNNSHSKSMHILNHKQTFSKAGMLGGLLSAFKKSVADPQGHIEFPAAGEFGKDFGVMPTQNLVGPHFEMYQDASSEFDVSGANAALTGGTTNSLSGKALDRLQSGGQIELGPLFGTHSFWKSLIYRAVWDRIKQFKREEWWIRVTDTEENLKYVGLNVPFTLAEQKVMEQTGSSLSQVREKFGPELEQLYAQVPQMGEIVAVENEVAEIDVDVIIKEVPDVINLQSEQFDLLVKMYTANPNGIPWESVVEMSSLRNKEKILGKELEPEQEAAMQEQKQKEEALLGIQVEGQQADTELKQTQTAINKETATQKRLETIIMAESPDPNPQSII